MCTSTYLLIRIFMLGYTRNGAWVPQGRTGWLGLGGMLLPSFFY